MKQGRIEEREARDWRSVGEREVLSREDGGAVRETRLRLRASN